MKTQLEIVGTERASIPELDDLVRAWFKSRAAKAEATKAEKEDAASVQAGLAEHGLEEYTWEDGERRAVVAREVTERARFISVRDGVDAEGLL